MTHGRPSRCRRRGGARGSAPPRRGARDRRSGSAACRRSTTSRSTIHAGQRPRARRRERRRQVDAREGDRRGLPARRGRAARRRPSRVAFHAPRDALAPGIATIAQEIALVPARTVLENVLLGIESSTGRRACGSRELRRRFDELNERTGFGLDPLAVVRSLRTAEQQKVEILRAIARDARLLLMDEPTAALTRDETERLLETMRAARRRRHRDRARLALPRGGARASATR